MVSTSLASCTSRPPYTTSDSDLPAADWTFSIASSVWLNNWGRSCSCDSLGVKLTTTFSPSVSTCISPLAIASSSALTISSALWFFEDSSVSSLFDCSEKSSSLVLFCTSSLGWLTWVVCWVILLVTEGDGEGLKFKDRIVVPFGGSTTGVIRWTPNAFFNEPEICLNLGTLNSANERIRTKNAMRSVAMSANVAIHAGAPTGGHLGHSSSSVSSTFSSSCSLATIT